ncbi:IclR family transcriptional regulator domain-containing protein [Diaphorobacter caeni]|uniref:IclR family transcriptional regulator domain-containing protein n=1 Tax=Diaphorobacter caeni TaxID=2784387 RepID=UPI00188FBCC6|nr:IclR family transcriptional regulator C-terminal domain-containing protein [Diaphorobacter caeni]MBF5007242.1 helix-turn-helix domain-containing protein [Diaphorobacter caeni]
MATPESESFVRTFARGLRVIEVMGQSTGRQNMAQISEAAQLPRTVVRRLLLTLIELGFVGSDDKDYWLTPKVLRLGMTYLYTLPFWRQSQMVLEELGTRIKQSCAVSVLDDGDIVYIQRFHTKRILAFSPSIGSRLPAYSVSMGKVLLSGLRDDKLDAYLEQTEFTALTPHTVIEKEKLRTIITQVRDQSYSWSDAEYDDSICGLAVPIRGHGGEIVAAINVSLISGEFTEEQARSEFLPLLKLAASRLKQTD